MNTSDAAISAFSPLLQVLTSTSYGDLIWNSLDRTVHRLACHIRFEHADDPEVCELTASLALIGVERSWTLTEDLIPAHVLDWATDVGARYPDASLLSAPISNALNEIEVQIRNLWLWWGLDDPSLARVMVCAVVGAVVDHAARASHGHAASRVPEWVHRWAMQQRARFLGYPL